MAPNNVKHHHAQKSTAFAQALVMLMLSALSAVQPGRASDGSALVLPVDQVGSIIRLPSAVVGKQYSRTLLIAGKPPYTFALESGRLDDLGLSMDAQGRLSGVPQKPGRFAFTVAVQDAQGGEPVRQRFELHVLKARKVR